MLHTYFLKMYLVWGYGEYKQKLWAWKSKCHLKVLSIYSFGMIERPVGWTLPISTLFPFKNSFLQPVCLLRIVTQRAKCSHAFCHAQGWQANDISLATITLARPNGAKIKAQKWRHVCAKNFPSEWARQNESKLHPPPTSASWLLPIWPQKKILSSFSISRDP